MFHSDLVYLRENMRGLKTVLKSEMMKHPQGRPSPPRVAVRKHGKGRDF